jgi:MFS family permease
MNKRSLRSNPALLALLLSNGLVLISLGMLVPIYALFVRQVGGNALSAGLTAGALAFASGLSALLSGRLIDHFSQAQTRYFLVIGFLKTISAPAFDTIYARHLDRSSTGQEYGVWEASFFMTAGVGAVLGGTVVSLYGFSGVFITMAVLAFIAAAYIAVLNDKILK